MATGAFDATGTYRFSIPVPAGASGLDVRAQVVTRDAAGVWGASNKASVWFR